jgi:hypothetical protein
MTVKIQIDASNSSDEELDALTAAPGYDKFIKHIANNREPALKFVQYEFIPIDTDNDKGFISKYIDDNLFKTSARFFTFCNIDGFTFIDSKCKLLIERMINSLYEMNRSPKDIWIRRNKRVHSSMTDIFLDDKDVNFCLCNESLIYLNLFTSGECCCVHDLFEVTAIYVLILERYSNHVLQSQDSEELHFVEGANMTKCSRLEMFKLIFRGLSL